MLARGISDISLYNVANYVTVDTISGTSLISISFAK